MTMSPLSPGGTPGAAHLEAFQRASGALRERIAAVADDGGVADCARDLDAVRAMVGEGVQWWVGYDVRRVQEAVGELGAALDAAKERVKPRERFRFRRRHVTVPVVPEVPGKVHAGEMPAVAVSEREICERKPTKGGEIVLADAVGETFMLRNDEIAGRDVVLARLKDCTVSLLGVCGAVRAMELVDCVVFTGPVSGSMHVTACVGGEMRVVARQLRIHETHRVAFYLLVASGPIIEHSDELVFAPYEFGYDGLEPQLQAARLDSCANQWENVKDFNWLQSEASPNWSKMPPEQWRVVSQGQTRK